MHSPSSCPAANHCCPVPFPQAALAHPSSTREERGFWSQGRLRAFEETPLGICVVVGGEERGQPHREHRLAEMCCRRRDGLILLAPQQSLATPGQCPYPFLCLRQHRRMKERSASPPGVFQGTRRGGTPASLLLSTLPHQLCSARQGCLCRVKGHIWSHSKICLHLQALARRVGGSPAAGAVLLTLPTPSRLDRARAGFISPALAAGLS